MLYNIFKIRVQFSPNRLISDIVEEIEIIKKGSTKWGTLSCRRKNAIKLMTVKYPGACH